MEIRSIAEGIQAVGVTAVAEKQPCEVENMVLAFLAVHQVKMVACIFHEQRVCEESLSHQFETGELQQKVKAREIDPHTLIHKAILENNAEVIRFLLAHGVDVDYPDENGMSPLTVAILNGCSNVVKELLEHGADTNPDVKWNDMPLLELALYLEDLSSTKLLLEYGANANFNLHGQWEAWTPLTFVMVKLKNFELAKLMVNAGAFVNNRKDPARSPLAVAAGYSSPIDFIRFLIEKGADVNLKYKDNHPKATELSLFWRVIQQKDDELIKVFVEGGVNLNESPCLAHCIGNNYSSEIIYFLIENGANVNGTLESPGGPLQIALVRNNLAIVNYLIDHGADVNLHHPLSYTPLMQAVQSGDLNLVKVLVESGANVNKTCIRNGKAISPLKIAVELNKPAVVQYLLQHGAKG